MKAVLGIDTSCYTTSVAAASLEDERILQCRRLLNVQGAAGLRQSEALFRHVKNLPELMSELFAQDEIDIAAVCCSTKPRPVADSYMPVFLAGQSVAESVAAAMSVPMFRTSHQEGHIAAGLLGSGVDESKRFIALHLSGGTTELILCGGGEQRLIGGTNDITIGQLIDRAGVALGMEFPCGAELERLAIDQSKLGEPQRLITARVGGDLACSLSGAESQTKAIADKVSPGELALEVFSCAERTISKLIVEAAERYDVKQFLLVGGVASSSLIREKAEKRVAKRSGEIELFYGKREYCSDNAVGAALIGEKLFKSLSI